MISAGAAGFLRLKNKNCVFRVFSMAFFIEIQWDHKNLQVRVKFCVEFKNTIYFLFRLTPGTQFELFGFQFQIIFEYSFFTKNTFTETRKFFLENVCILPKLCLQETARTKQHWKNETCFVFTWYVWLPKNRIFGIQKLPKKSFWSNIWNPRKNSV